jgi:hypothetical protein
LIVGKRRRAGMHLGHRGIEGHVKGPVDTFDVGLAGLTGVPGRPEVGLGQGAANKDERDLHGRRPRRKKEVILGLAAVFLKDIADRGIGDLKSRTVAVADRR